MTAVPGPARVPALLRGLCDDAAVFPPGSLPLAQAVPAHRAHRAAQYAELVGPLVLAAPSLAELGALLRDVDTPDATRLDLVVTAPHGPAQLAEALRRAEGLPVRVTGAEVAVPAHVAVDACFAELARVADALPAASVAVEIPRDERRAATVAGCAAAGYRAKFRTGGVRADLHPDEAELAAALAAVTAAGVSFKATAGLHHAVRNTAVRTGFEQHGFLTVLLAAEAAAQGAEHEELVRLLASRDAAALAQAAAALAADPARTARARARFGSFGTCSIAEPLDELIALGLLPAGLTPSTAAGAPAPAATRTTSTQKGAATP